MNEYQIHTPEKKDHRRWVHDFYGYAVAVIAIVGLIHTAIANDPASRERLQMLEKARAMTQAYSEHETVSTETKEPDLNQLNNFVAVAQKLIDDRWPVTTVSADGIATIQGKDLVLLCGVLVSTSSNSSDVGYPQFADSSSLEKKLGIKTKPTTLIWGDEYTQLDQDINVTAEIVDTTKEVWVCKEQVNIH